MARKSSTPKSLELMRVWGWNYWSVEKFNAFSGRKTDLFNIIDLVVITPFSTIGVQTCGVDVAPHIKKLTQDELSNTVEWLSCKNRKLILIGWRKVLRKRGGKLMVFKPRILWFYITNNELICEEMNTDTTIFKEPKQ